jgi:predicted nucleotidyltransferase
MNAKELSEKYLIYKCLAGSHAYGTNIESSDIDTRGLFIAPPSVSIGCMYTMEQFIDPDIDEQLFELKKFTRLAAECNPNIIELLFTDEKNIQFIDPIFKIYREQAPLFLSKKAKHTFSGYAMSQLKRIKGHNKWINNPQPEEEPKLTTYIRWVNALGYDVKISSFDLERYSNNMILTKVNEHIYKVYSVHNTTKFKPGIFSSDRQQMKYIDIDLKKLDEALQQHDLDYSGMLFVSVDDFKTAHTQWHQYWTWKRERNPQRALLEESHGFDCYSDDTEFLTKDGWKKFEEVTKDTLLATVFINNSGRKMEHRSEHLGVEYQQFIDKFEGKYTGDMYNLFGYHTDTLVTPNHRMLISREERRSRKKYSWDLTESFQLPDTFNCLRFPTPKKTTYDNQDFFKNLPISPEQYLRLMGWYLSDGALHVKNNSPKKIIISQKKNGKLYGSMKKFRNKYSKISHLYEYIHKPSEYRPYSIVEATLVVNKKSGIPDKMYKDCGNLKNKRIPRWVFSLSSRLMTILLDALIRGDGTTSRPDNSIIYYSTLKNLADDVQELALLSGYETSLYGPYLQEDRNLTMYQVHINKTREQLKTFIRSRNIIKIPTVDRRIVCFTVPNGTLVTRRNGHISIHGNSKHASHLVRLLKMGEEILKEGKVIVHRPDAEELKAIRNGAWTYEQLVNWAETKDAELSQLYETSSLPHAPNIDKINELYIETILTYWKEKELL